MLCCKSTFVHVSSETVIQLDIHTKTIVFKKKVMTMKDTQKYQQISENTSVSVVILAPVKEFAE